MSLTIKDNLREFGDAIATGTSIDCYADGSWYRVNWFMRIIYWIFSCLDNSRVARVTSVFNSFLDGIEANNKAICERNPYVLEQAQDARLVGKLFKERFSHWKANAVSSEIVRLSQRLIGMSYRFGPEIDGRDKEKMIDQQQFDQISAIALEWKRAQELLKQHHDEVIVLTEHDLKAIEDVTLYPKFSRLLQKEENGELRDRVFKAIIRDHIDPAIVVEFPGTLQKIHDCLLQHPVGCFEKPLLNLKEVNGYKHVTLLCGKRDVEANQNISGEVDILNPSNRFDFGGGVVRTVQEIFDQFKEKRWEHGDLTPLPEGISKHDAVNLNEVMFKDNVERKDWFVRVPVVEKLNLAAAQERYKNAQGTQLDGTNCGGRIIATREMLGLGAKGTHAYFEFATPCKNEDGSVSYEIRTFGKTAPTLPRTNWQFARIVGETVEGRIMSPETCVHLPRRQHWGHPFVMTAEEGERVTNWIGDSIISGLRQEMGYQLFVENCVKWVMELGDATLLGSERVPENLFTVDWAESEPDGVLGTVFPHLVQTPFWIQDIVFGAFAWLLGSTVGRLVTDTKRVVGEDGTERIEKTRRYVSLAAIRPWAPGYNGNDFQFMIPAKFHVNRENGLFPIAEG